MVRQIVFATVAWIFLCLVPSCAQAQQILWSKDFAQAKSEASQSQKLLLLHFGASWCRPCQEVESFVFRNPSVVRRVNDLVIPIRVDVDQEPKLAEQYQVKSIPCDVLITAEGKLVKKRNSPRDADAYLMMLGEVEALSTNLKTEGTLNLDRMAQMQAKWEEATENKEDQMEFGEFDQQRPPSVPNPALAVKSPEQKLKQEQAIAEKTKITGGGNFDFGAKKQTSADSMVNSPSASNDDVSQANLLPSTSEAAPFDGLAQTGGVDQKRIVNPYVNENNSAGTDTPAAATGVSHSPPATTNNVANDPVASSRDIQEVSGTISNPTLCLDGDCPVSLLKSNKWVKGNPRFGAVHRGRIYLFESVECQAEFLKDPEAYSPILAGFDPVLYHEQGYLVEGTKEHGVFMSKNGRQHVVLFQDEHTRTKFRDNPALYLDTVRSAAEKVDSLAR